MRQSMTGFASVQGAGLGFTWTWEMRGVNGKGLDLRLRVPDWIEGLEVTLRARLSKALTRGNLQVSLRVTSDGAEGQLRLDETQLATVLQAMALIEERAMSAGVSLAPSTSSDIVALRGVLTTEAGEVDQVELRKAILEDFEAALASFVDMRKTEGQNLQEILTRQMAEIKDLVTQAEGAIADRNSSQSERLRSQLARVMENVDTFDESRLAQELALIAVKSDVTEEIDRLHSHVAAVEELLATEGAVGRKLDFLMQEFNREANTLCSKSGDAALTQVGLALKTVIDQLREQVQNVE